MKKRKKRSITLIEIMIVILLIGLIGGALAYNMSGSLDQGRLFKTKQNISRANDILMMEYAKGDESLQKILERKREILKASPLVKDGEKLLKDGWGHFLDFSIVNDEIVIRSSKAESVENGGVQQQNGTT